MNADATVGFRASSFCDIAGRKAAIITHICNLEAFEDQVAAVDYLQRPLAASGERGIYGDLFVLIRPERDPMVRRRIEISYGGGGIGSRAQVYNIPAIDGIGRFLKRLPWRGFRPRIAVTAGGGDVIRCWENR
jgi:hypothetical protein